MDLIVDIGNTRIKWAFFKNDTVVAEGVVEKEFLLLKSVLIGLLIR